MKHLSLSKYFALTAFFIFGLLVFHSNLKAAGLIDIQGHKNQTAIQWIYERNVISGYPDGTFKPDAGINRAEMMKILVEAKMADLSSGQYKNCFPDVREEWFAGYVCYAQVQGWVEGYPDGTFKPEQGITKEEAIKMLVNSRVYALPDPAAIVSGSLFEDAALTEWYTPYLYVAKEKEILEQTGGIYGVGTFITRGEVAENIYRALIVDENVLEKFTDYESTPTLPNENSQACDIPVRAWGDISANKDQMNVLKIPVCEGYRYTACTEHMMGNPDLYGGSTEPTINQFEKKSTDGFRIVKNDDQTETQFPRPDCITFEPKTADYYLGVYGAAEGTKTNIWVTSSKMNNVPEGFEKSLTWFNDSCTGLTNEQYGPFNAPWGNAEDLDRPFFEGYPNYLHAGVDIACPASTEVRAMCDGVVTDSANAGGDWGWHTVTDCKSGGETISIAFIHLDQEGLLPVGTAVKTGDVIGKVFPMQIAGEEPHVHLTGCKGSRADCEAYGFHPERGAGRRAEWWTASELWFDMDWRSNPDLYKNLPQ